MSSQVTPFSLECQAIITIFEAERQITQLGGYVAPQVRRLLQPLTSINLEAGTAERIEAILRRSDNQKQNS